MSEKEIVLVGVGDLLIRDPEPDYLFDSTREVFQSADIRFGNCEQPYAWRYPEMAAAFKRNCGFEVMNFANNHILDHGAEVFLNTIAQLKAAGIEVIGAGATIKEARSPAIIEKEGVRIAFLGYNSIQVPSYQATGARPGCAPLKAHTAYQQLFEEAPGTPARVRTFADDDDLAAVLADIAAVKEKADLVIVSLHWGPLLKSSHISDFQPVAAHAIIDAGADLILGHHPHTNKGVEVYKGKVIFYSINHFIMKNEKPVTINYSSHGYVTNSHIQDMLETFPGEFGFYDDYPLYPFGPETLNTMIVKARISGKQIKSVSILPCRIGTDYQPRLLKNDEPEFAAAVEQIRTYSAAAKLSANFTVQGNELLVTP